MGHDDERFEKSSLDAGECGGQPTEAGWLPRCAAAMTLVFWLLAAAHLLLAISMDRSMLNHDALTNAVKRTLTADELLGVVFVLAIIGMPVALVRRCTVSRRGWIRWSGRLGVLLITWFALFLYACSWCSFRSTGVFLNAEGLRLFLTNSIQFLQHVAHMEPYVAVTVPALVAAIAILLPWGLTRLMTTLSGRTLVRMSIGGAVSVALLLALSLNGIRSATEMSPDAPVVDSDVGLVYSYQDLHASARDELTGPMRHLWADICRQWRADQDLNFRPMPVDFRPIVGLDDYIESAGKPVRKPNVILILVESLRTDQLQSCGGSQSVMPAVDAVAARGRVFQNHYTQASHSNYADPCPLTSHFPLRSPHTYVYPKQPAYPRLLIYDILHAIGYRTAIISSQNENWGGMLGFLRTPGLEHLFHAETFDGPTYVPRGDTGFENFIKGKKRAGKIDDRFTVDEAIRWIDEVGDDPFFMYLNLQSSHLPYETPADFPRKFGRENLPFTIRFNNYPREQAHLVKQQYANSLAYVDSHLRRLFRHLDDRGLDEQTILVISGDTGQAFYEHGFAAHANMVFNEVMRVPLIIAGPGVPVGSDDRLAQHVDVPPTILDLVGLRAHPSFQGNSLLKNNPPAGRAAFLVAQCPSSSQVAVVQDGFKLIHDLHSDRRVLFDLKHDPGETMDVSRLHAAQFDALRKLLDSWHYWQLRYYRDVELHRGMYPPRLGI